MNKEFHMNTWRPNDDFIKYDDNEEYTYKELLELLDQGDTMLVVINKQTN